MKTKNSLSAIAAIFLTANLAYAGTLAQGMMYGGPSQAYSVCYLFNASSAAVNITAKSIFRQTALGTPGIKLPFVSSDCPSSLLPNATCTIASNVVNNAAHACKFDVSSTSAVRGVLELRDVNGKVLQAQNLR